LILWHEALAARGIVVTTFKWMVFHAVVGIIGTSPLRTVYGAPARIETPAWTFTVPYGDTTVARVWQDMTRPPFMVKLFIGGRTAYTRAPADILDDVLRMVVA
jgi:hypothetical protein